MGNKINFGLKNVHYAVVTEAGGEVEYGTPKRIPGAVNLTLDAAGESVLFYADDSVYYEEDTNDGYTGSLEMALIPDDFRVDVLGYEVDSNGTIGENKDAKVKKFALMFEFDGDAKKTRHVFYNVLAGRPTISGSTRTNTKEPQTETMNITARPAIDTGDVNWKVKQGDAPYDTFFTAVYLKNAPTNTIESADDEFDKNDPADIIIDCASTDGNNEIKNVLLDGLPIAGVKLTIVGVDVTIDQSVFAGLALGNHEIKVEFLRGNAVTTTITVTNTTP